MTDLNQLDNEALQQSWQQLTIYLLRKGFGVLWMLHFVHTEFDKLCDDPVMRKRIGVEPFKVGDSNETN